MFHNRISAEDDGIADDFECVALGCDSEQDLIKELDIRKEEAISEILPTERKNQLGQMLHKHVSVLNLRLENGAPAHITPMQTRLDRVGNRSRSKCNGNTLNTGHLWIITSRN